MAIAILSSSNRNPHSTYVCCFSCLHAREYHRDCLRPLLKLVLTKVFGRSLLQQQAEAEEKEAAQAKVVVFQVCLLSDRCVGTD